MRSRIKPGSDKKVLFDDLRNANMDDLSRELDESRKAAAEEVESLLALKPPELEAAAVDVDGSTQPPGIIYMQVIQSSGIDVHAEPDLESKVLYHVEKSNVISCSLKQKILGVPWYSTIEPSKGWVCGESPMEKAHVLLHDQNETQVLFFPTLMLTNENFASKRFELEKLERRTISAQIVRLLIQCYGLHDARKVSDDTLNVVQSLEDFNIYNLEATEFSDVEQDHLGADGMPKRLTPFDIIPIMARITKFHSHPQVAALDCARQVVEISKMRPSEWGYKEWGFEGEYGHRVLILDDLTRQQVRGGEDKVASARR